MNRISGKNNQQIKDLAALQKQKKARTEAGAFVVEGVRIFRDVLTSAPELILRVYLSESFLNSELLKGDALLSDLDFTERFETFVVEDRLFESACETVTPQGIMCVVKQPSYSLERLVSETDGGIRLLLLENIQDPGNLGTMFRTAEAAGMNGIIMSRGTADVFSPKVTRSTMGSIFRIPFVYVEDLVSTVSELEARGIGVYAAYLHGGEPYNKVAYSENAAVLIGNEGNGLTEEVVKAASHRVFIPMAGRVESLNAAVAAALMMYKCRE